MEGRVIVVKCLVDQHQVVSNRNGVTNLGLLLQPVLQLCQYLEVARVLESVCMGTFNDDVEMVGAAEFVIDDIKSLADIGITGKVGDGLGADMDL